jgi:hypothetical protein
MTERGAHLEGVTRRGAIEIPRDPSTIDALNKAVLKARKIAVMPKRPPPTSVVCGAKVERQDRMKWLGTRVTINASLSCRDKSGRYAFCSLMLPIDRGPLVALTPSSRRS